MTALPTVEPSNMVVSTPPHGAAMGVPYVGSLSLTLPVSMDRMFENALDWEHLPFVHSSSFSSIEKIDDGPWGWHANADITGSDESVRVELRVERELRRWISRIHEGPGAGSEVWTNVSPNGDDEIHVVIDFYAPHNGPEEAAFYLEVLSETYKQLYREDLALMLDRQSGLDDRRRRLGAKADVDGAVVRIELADGLDGLPMVVEAFGHPWRVVATDAGPKAHTTRCPHALGSMDESEVVGDEVICPWHGYRFNLDSGQELTGHKCKLPTPPAATVEDETLVLRR